MSTPFKMKGFSGFGNSPMKQGLGVTEKKTKKTVDLMKTAATTDKPAEYYKLVDGKKVKISEDTYNSLKSQ